MQKIIIFFVAVVAGVSVSAGLALGATTQRTCAINYGNFTTANATKVSCKVAKKTVIAWWKKGGEESPCYTASGCKVGVFRCGVTWDGYVGNGKCKASGGRKITFTFGE